MAKCPTFITPEDCEFGDAELSRAPAITTRQSELLTHMSKCTPANYGCASGDAWTALANEFYAQQMLDEEKHEQASAAMEAING